MEGATVMKFSEAWSQGGWQTQDSKWSWQICHSSPKPTRRTVSGIMYVARQTLAVPGYTGKAPGLLLPRNISQDPCGNVRQGFRTQSTWLLHSEGIENVHSIVRTCRTVKLGKDPQREHQRAHTELRAQEPQPQGSTAPSSACHLQNRQPAPVSRVRLSSLRSSTIMALWEQPCILNHSSDPTLQSLGDKGKGIWRNRDGYLHQAGNHDRRIDV